MLCGLIGCQTQGHISWQSGCIWGTTFKAMTFDPCSCGLKDFVAAGGAVILGSGASSTHAFSEGEGIKSRPALQSGRKNAEIMPQTPCLRRQPLRWLTVASRFFHWIYRIIIILTCIQGAKWSLTEKGSFFSLPTKERVQQRLTGPWTGLLAPGGYWVCCVLLYTVRRDFCYLQWGGFRAKLALITPIKSTAV